jgi:PIN domain nuclease of toxin-antitoxin system
MRVLLDTHIALWVLTDSPKLSARARELIQAADAQVYASAASIWEISIKHRLQRAQMPVSGQQALKDFVASGFELLPIAAEHAAAVDHLPLHHQDPFDRLLIAQAQHEPMYLLTRDPQLKIYSDLVILV